MEIPGTKSTWFEGFEKREFLFEGQAVTIVCPQQSLTRRFWAWKGEFLDAFPKADLALLRKGLHLVYLSFPDQFGSPAAVQKWNNLYALLTGSYGFEPKVALIGMSRGGLYCYQWAAANPDQVACIYGDAPVCDMRSWPGGKGKGAGSSADWQKVMTVFGFKSEAEAITYPLNPVDRLAPLAAAAIPILHVYGDADDVVPWDENTGILAARYRTLGGQITLITKPGCGHHPHGLDDPAPITDFIWRHTASLLSRRPVPDG